MQVLNIPQKEELIDIINSFDNFKGELAEDYIKFINESYEIGYELNRFRIKKILIDENKGTVYTGLRVIIDSLKPITIILGTNNTGKTISFEKLFHLFCNYTMQKDSINRLVTKLELILVDEINLNQEYSIKFHSSSKLNGARFQITKQVLDNKGNVKQSIEIKDPEIFLKNHFLIEYNLNETMFVNEIPGETFVSKFCITEDKFRELFRISILNMLFDKITENKKDIDKALDRKLNFLKAYEADRNRINYILKNLLRYKINDKFLVDNEDQLIFASQEFEKISEKLKKQAEEELRKLRAKKNDLAKKKELIKELERFNPEILNNRFDALYQTISNYCFECDSIILPEEFKDRVIRNRCYVCGIGDRDYSLEFKVLPNNYADDFKNQMKNIAEEIKNLENEISNFLIEKQELIPKPENVEEKIWKQIQFAVNIEEEIISAKERFPEYDIKINSLNSKIEEIENKNSQLKDELDQLRNKSEPLQNLNDKLVSYEEDIFKGLKEKILSIVNNILIELTVENIGAINFDESGNLVFISSIFKDDENKEFENKYITYKDSKKRISQGILRKIDLAFSLAFLFVNRELLLRPLNTVIIDSLNNLDMKDIELILRDLSKKDDYQIIIFNTEKPEKIIENKTKVVEIIRNPRMRKPDAVKNVKKESNLDRFLK